MDSSKLDLIPSIKIDSGRECLPLQNLHKEGNFDSVDSKGSDIF